MPVREWTLHNTTYSTPYATRNSAGEALAVLNRILNEFRPDLIWEIRCSSENFKYACALVLGSNPPQWTIEHPYRIEYQFRTGGGPTAWSIEGFGRWTRPHPNGTFATPEDAWAKLAATVTATSAEFRVVDLEGRVYPRASTTRGLWRLHNSHGNSGDQGLSVGVTPIECARGFDGYHPRFAPYYVTDGTTTIDITLEEHNSGIFGYRPHLRYNPDESPQETFMPSPTQPVPTPDFPNDAPLATVCVKKNPADGNRLYPYVDARRLPKLPDHIGVSPDTS